jgi:hypothetical protein
MRTSLEIESGMAAKIREVAAAKNLSIEDLLGAYVPGLLSSKNNNPIPTDPARALDEWIAEIPDTPPLSDEAISRSSIYGER